MECVEVEVGEGVVVLLAESEVAAVFEAPACKEDGHVFVVVAGGVSKVGGEQGHGAVEEGGFLQFAEEVGPFVDDRLLHDGELVEFGLVFAVVGEPVVAF